MNVHPAANLFPLLEGEEYEALKKDISDHGQQEPVVVWKGHDVLLDGRNRVRACKELHIDCLHAEVEFDALDVDGEEAAAISYIVSRNLRRRHLSVSQRAMIAADLVPLFEKAAKERQAQGGREKVPQKKGEPSEDPHEGEATAQAAKAVGVSRESVRKARKVQKTAPPEVVAAVRAGKVAVSAAAGGRKKLAATGEWPKRSRPWRRGARGTMWRVPQGVDALATFVRQKRPSTWCRKLAQLLVAGTGYVVKGKETTTP